MKKKIRLVLLLAVFSVVFSMNTFAAYIKYPMNYVYEEGENRSGNANGRIYIPITYSVEESFSYINDETSGLVDAEDLFIDKNNCMYIADTGNNRIVALSPSGETMFVLYGAGGSDFSSPRGVFVNEEGIFVADSGNSRIILTNSQGELIAEYTRPESELLVNMQSFDPSKISVGPTGYMYILAGKELMAIDRNNSFKGFLGATEVGFSLTQSLIRMFATKEQKNLIARRNPPSYNNFLVDNQGRFIACSGAKENQLRIINSVGKNIYKKGFFGEISDIDENNQPIYPNFIDISVSDTGVISALDEKSGHIYQYDSEGNLLTVFGGKGENRGYFISPSSIAQDSDGNIYVLDKARGNIQKYVQTEFIKKIHTALDLYYQGEYEKSMPIWNEIAVINSNYPLARKLTGSIYTKRQEYANAVKEYEIADDMVGYSNAFSKNRHEIFRANFALCVGIIIAVAIALWFGISALKKYSNKVQLDIYEKRGGKRK
ncbi:MAG: hypothetical protein E7480_07490 [Ruminococcaceae bacterium]|nr:hypothetical protein [Oscillospiraceae bacterium]